MSKEIKKKDPRGRKPAPFKRQEVRVSYYLHPDDFAVFQDIAEARQAIHDESLPVVQSLIEKKKDDSTG